MTNEDLLIEVDTEIAAISERIEKIRSGALPTASEASWDRAIASYLSAQAQLIAVRRQLLG